MDLLIIGIDGADPGLIERWSDELPCLSQLQQDGASGRLRSTAMPITPAAWTSLLSGTNPGSHGIFDFTQVTEDHRLAITTTDARDDPTLFQLLDDHQIGALNVPATYPPTDPDDGFMVAGMLSPDIRSATTDPAVADRLEAMDYRIEVEDTFDGDNEEELLSEIETVLQKRGDAAQALLQDHDPDTFMVTFTVLDRIQHWFWKHMDPDHPSHEPGDEAYSHVIREYYQKTDHEIGELLEHTDEDTTVVVVSDHGFTRLEHGLNINSLLMEEGYLVTRDHPSTRIRELLHRAGVTQERCYRLVQRIGLGHHIKQIADSVEHSRLRELLSLPFLGLEDIDWDQTQAYSALHFGPIFLTPDDEDERAELRDEIASLLREIEHEGTPIIDEVEFREDVFSGPHLEDAPDIIYQTQDMAYQAHRYFEFGSNQLVTEPHNTESGHHSMHGVLIAAGPGIRETTIEGTELIDIAPTLLHLTGHPVPEHMDGRVLTELFTSAAAPARHQEPER